MSASRRAAEIADAAERHYADPTKASRLFIPPQTVSFNNNLGFAYDNLEEAFPDVDPGIAPLGSQVLVLIRVPKLRTASGLLIDSNTRQIERDNTQVAKVIALGPLAFRNRETGEFWPEGAWVSVGDFVRVPKYQGDRFAVSYTRPDFEIDDTRGTRTERTVPDEVHFVQFKDLAILGRITGDPLTIKAFI